MRELRSGKETAPFGVEVTVVRLTGIAVTHRPIVRLHKSMLSAQTLVSVSEFNASGRALSVSIGRAVMETLIAEPHSTITIKISTLRTRAMTIVLTRTRKEIVGIDSHSMGPFVQASRRRSSKQKLRRLTRAW